MVAKSNRIPTFVKKKGPGRGAGPRKPKEETSLELTVEHVAAVPQRWSICQECDQKFSINELRIAYREIKTCNGLPDGSNYWHHTRCLATTKTSPWRRRVADVAPHDIHGCDELSPDEQGMIRALLNDMCMSDVTESPTTKSFPRDTRTLLCLQEADKLNLRKKLEILASKGDIAKFYSTSQVLDALKAASGSVVQAKTALLANRHGSDAAQHETEIADEMSEVVEASPLGPPLATRVEASKCWQEADKLNLRNKLENLASKAEIAKFYSTSQVLEALKAASGSVVQAKKALLGNRHGSLAAQHETEIADEIMEAVDAETENKNFKNHKPVMDSTSDRMSDSMSHRPDSTSDSRGSRAAQRETEIADDDMEAVDSEATDKVLQKKLEVLSARPEIARLNVPASDLLKILTAQGGSVVLAKKAVLASRRSDRPDSTSDSRGSRAAQHETETADVIMEAVDAETENKNLQKRKITPDKRHKSQDSEAKITPEKKITADSEAKDKILQKKLEVLAARPEIARLNVPASDLLKILTAQGGSIVLAKKAVLVDRQSDRPDSTSDSRGSCAAQHNTEMAVDSEAKDKILEKKLEVLAARPEIARLNVPASALLKILTAQGGSVVLAKKAVLGDSSRALGTAH